MNKEEYQEIISGVYKIENKVNGKFYIGSSRIFIADGSNILMI